MKSSNRGFTFIELLITLAVISICFLPLMNMFSVSLQQTSFVNDITTARYLAQEGMEKVKNLSFTVDQLRKAGDVWEPVWTDPPLNINGHRWRVLRKVVSSSDPLEIHIQVFQEEDLQKNKLRAKPVVDLVTLFEDFDWSAS